MSRHWENRPPASGIAIAIHGVRPTPPTAKRRERRLPPAVGFPPATGRELGTALFTDYLVPFELLSVLLLAALLGALMVARAEDVR